MAILKLKKRLFEDKVQLKGVITLTIRDKNGKIRLKKTIKNTITDNGKTRIAQLICGLSTTSFKYIGIGSGTASASGLGSPIAYIQASVGANVSGAWWDITYTASSSVTVTEAVLCDSSSGGTVLSYQNFSGISLIAGEQLSIHWAILLS